MPEIEEHPLKPFLPRNARLLMLGSFPPQQKRWCMDFYYPNMQNDMWRIFGIIFFQNKDYFLTENKKSFDKERIIAFLNEKGIAIFDTASAIIRQKDNASDKFLEVVTPTDIKTLLTEIPVCEAIVTTGQKATDTLLALFPATEPKVGSYSVFDHDGQEMKLFRMPSSSRAYPKPLTEKAAIYQTMFEELKMI